MPLTPDAQAGLSDSGINNSESASSNHTLSALDETLERPFKLPAFLEIPPPSSSLEDAPTSQSLKLPGKSCTPGKYENLFDVLQLHTL